MNLGRGQRKRVEVVYQSTIKEEKLSQRKSKEEKLSKQGNGSSKSNV